MGHGVGGRDQPAARLDTGSAAHVATTGQALATPSRLMIRTVYSRYDNHVAQLLDETVYHSEHLRLGLTDQSDATG